jgi:hypothetical protein
LNSIEQSTAPASMHDALTTLAVAGLELPVDPNR